MEPERRIEKLLRAFAKKRREQAPESMKLHSAMRQQLHRGIAHRGEGKASGGFFAKLFPGRPWLGFAVGFSAFVMVCLLFLVPLMNPSKSERLAENTKLGKAPPTEVMSPASAPESPPVATAPSVAVAPPTPQESSAIALNDRQSVKSLDVPQHEHTATEVAGESATREIQKPIALSKDVASETNFAMDVAALSTPPSSNIATLAFKSENQFQTLSGGGASLGTQTAPAAPPPASINASAPPTTPAANEKGMRNFAPESAPASVAADSATFYRLAQNENSAAQLSVSQNFRRLNLPANSPRATRSGPAPVLASFLVEQNGDQLRMVDADGSVYTGNVQVAQEVAYGVTAAAAQNKSAGYMENRDVSGSAAAQNYFFRVAGTNRNLNQNIIFTGNFIPLTNIASHQTNFGNAIAARRPATEQSESSTWLLNSRIAGNVTLDDQKQIEVKAAPTTK